jgi:hypothetical protein
MDYPGERMIRRLFETLAENGVASLLQPWHLRRELPTKAVLQQLDTLSLSWRDISLDSRKLIQVDPLVADDARNFSEPSGGLRSYSITRSELARAVTQNLITDGLRQQVNVSKAVLYAEAELAADAQGLPDVQVDGDWLQRWRTRAGEISSDELSSLWGRILAGEVRQPGNCSLRTLEFLGNLSREEAADISSAAPFVLGNVMLKHDGLFEKAGLSFGVLSGLQELGLISGVGSSLSTTIKSEVGDEFHFSWDVKRLKRRLLISHNDPAKVLNLPVFHVSRLGKEVFKIAQSAPTEECLVATVMLIEAQDYIVRVEAL